MRCEACERLITRAQIKAKDYRRIEVLTADCEPMYNLAVHVSCAEELLQWV